jgi:hypothetical protein
LYEVSNALPRGYNKPWELLPNITQTNLQSNSVLFSFKAEIRARGRAGVRKSGKNVGLKRNPFFIFAKMTKSSENMYIFHEITFNKNFISVKSIRSNIQHSFAKVFSGFLQKAREPFAKLLRKYENKNFSFQP